MNHPLLPLPRLPPRDAMKICAWCDQPFRCPTEQPNRLICAACTRRRRTTFYRGWRDADGTAHVTADNVSLPLRLDLVNHSPTGFEWGYAGSGPAQLSVAILADALRSGRRAVRLHQRFKFEVIAALDRDAEWKIVGKTVRQIAARLEREKTPCSPSNSGSDS